MPARRPRAPSRRGRPAAGPARPRPATFDWSTPALAHTKPWRVSQISTPSRGAQQLGRLVEHRLHQPRVLAVLGGQRARALAGLDVGERAHPALGLGHDLVGDHEHVAVGQVGGRGGRQQRGQVVARRRRSGRRARGRGAAERLGQAGTGGRAPAPASGRAGAARRAWRAPGRGGRRASRPARPGRRPVSTSSTSVGACSTAQGTPAASAAAACRSQLPGPKLGSIASGGLSSSALVPVPWRSGTITTPELLLVPAAQQARDLAGVEQRRVAGHEQHALEAARLRVADRRSARPPTGPPARCRAAPAPARRARPTRPPRSAVTTATASSPGTRRSEASTSENIACASAWREPGAERGGQALLGGAEALHGEDRDGAHRWPRPDSSESSAKRRAAPALSRRGSAQTPGSFVPAAACARGRPSACRSRGRAGPRRARRPRSPSSTPP